MPKVLAILLLLIATTAGAVEPKGFVIKGAFVQSNGSVTTDYFPGDGKVIIFKTEKDCNKIKDKIDAIFKEKSPDLQYLQICIPTPKGLISGVEKRPEA